MRPRFLIAVTSRRRASGVSPSLSVPSWSSCFSKLASLGDRRYREGKGAVRRARRDRSSTDVVHKNSIAPSALRISAFLFGTSSLAAAQPHGAPSTHITNIFAPASTPARTIYDLSLFVLAVTAVIFVIVASLLVYAIVKFRGRAADAGREPAQVYGSTQIELAWTVLPVLIVVVLFLATARVIHGCRMRQSRRQRSRSSPSGTSSGGSFGIRSWACHGKRAAHSGEQSPTFGADLLEVAFRRHRPQLLDSGTGRQDRLDSESRQRNVDGPAADRRVSRSVRAVLRDTARQNALARRRGQCRGL